MDLPPTPLLGVLASIWWEREAIRKRSAAYLSFLVHMADFIERIVLAFGLEDGIDKGGHVATAKADGLMTGG